MSLLAHCYLGDDAGSMAFQTSKTTDGADHEVSDHIYLSLLLLVK